MLTLDQIKEKTKELFVLCYRPSSYYIRYTMEIRSTINDIEYNFFLVFDKGKLMKVMVEDEYYFHECNTENWFSNNIINIKCDTNPFVNSYIKGE